MARPRYMNSTNQVAELDSSIALVLMGTVEADDIILISCGYRGPSSVTFNTPTHATLTFAPIQAQSGGVITQQRWYWARAAGGEGGSTVTCTKSSGTAAFHVQAHRFKNVVTSGNPYDETSGALQENTAAGPTVTFEAMTLGGDKRLIVNGNFEADNDQGPPIYLTAVDAPFTQRFKRQDNIGTDTTWEILTAWNADGDTSISATTGTQAAADEYSVQQFALLPDTSTAISAAIIDGLYGGADGTSYTTLQCGPDANALQTLKVTSTRATSDPSAPTVSGCGLTWVQVATILFRSGTASNYRITFFRALGASPTQGALTISFGAETQTSCNYSWVEFREVDTGGTNGSAAIVQSVTNSGTGATPTLTATLAAFGDSANNAGYMGGGYQDNSTFTPESGWNELHDTGGTTPVSSGTTVWRLSGSDLTPSTVAALGTGDWGTIAAEIKSAVVSAPSKTFPNPNRSRRALQRR